MAKRVKKSVEVTEVVVEVDSPTHLHRVPGWRTYVKWVNNQNGSPVLTVYQKDENGCPKERIRLDYNDFLDAMKIIEEER